MAQAAWGTKRRCPSCGAPFYDLNRHPIVCPKCNAEYVATPPRAPTRMFRGGKTAAPLPVAEETGFEEDEVVERNDEHDEDALIAEEADEDGDEMRD